MAKTAYVGAMAPHDGAGKPRADHTIEQQWDRYGAEEHDVWRTLFHRQDAILRERA